MNHSSYKYFIIEDDQAVWENIKRRMLHISNWEFSGATDCCMEAVNLIKNQKPHLIFLDWSIKNGNAYEILDFIKSINAYSPYVIFFTGYQSEHPEIPQEIINNYPVVKKYLIKPIYENLSKNLCQYVKEAENQFNKKTTYIIVENEHKHKYKIDTNDILAIIQCEINPRNKNIYLINNTSITIKSTMEEIINIANDYKINYFVTNKRKSIINKTHITKLLKPYVYLNDNFKVEVSRDNWKNLEL